MFTSCNASPNSTARALRSAATKEGLCRDEKLGEHLAHDPRDDEAILAQLLERLQLDASVRVRALRDADHAAPRRAARDVQALLPARRGPQAVPARITSGSGGQELEVTRVIERRLVRATWPSCRAAHGASSLSMSWMKRDSGRPRGAPAPIGSHPRRCR